ncbi:DJ-1/PfpI family protein [Bradyrhizobium ontarionense]|uniref:DJ-1/PfpI family protein n=1 Tax=Bradyrhizobium ontarionense TaxID=2898149 RepID=A0ABY3R642_9BRAD|nr:DJ-1/PfpI family protein [Bradyrhizobium sp. A19]UFZ02614.1 DJ-1/PfpI family protein [Bradyrhizobium sp. A19]
MLVYNDMILLDLVGPLTAFNMLQADVRLIARSMQPIIPDVRIPIAPTDTFETSPTSLDVLFVPGGLKGTLDAIRDDKTISFVKERGATAGLVTSVCTGSLLLGAAGLLSGYHATSHWYVRDLLAQMGAIVRKDRVVVDRNRITGGGVTAGIDFGLTIAARMAGEEAAKRIQLLIEYDPKPPFEAGSPEHAGTTLVDDVLARRKQLLAEAAIVVEAAGTALRSR